MYGTVYCKTALQYTLSLRPGSTSVQAFYCTAVAVVQVTSLTGHTEELSVLLFLTSPRFLPCAAPVVGLSTAHGVRGMGLSDPRTGNVDDDDDGDDVTCWRGREPMFLFLSASLARMARAFR